MRHWKPGAAITSGILLLAGCQESLTTPGICPEQCPGGSPQVLDTVLTPIPATDSSFRGFVSSSRSLALLISDSLPAGEARAWIRFSRRPDSLTINLVRQPFTIDSVALSVSLIGRDPTAQNLRLLYYRLPSSTDSSITFPELDGLLTPDRLIDSVFVPDTLVSGEVRLTLTDSLQLSRIEIPAEDSGVVAVGLRVRGDKPTGVRLESAFATVGSTPTFTSFVRGSINGDSSFVAALSQGSGFLFADGMPVDDPDLLAVGGVPSARSLLRFFVPERIRDTATIVRAILELELDQPAVGLPGDPGVLEGRPVLADFGAKSLAAQTGVAIAEVAAGTTGLVTLDVLTPVAGWRGGNTPQAILLGMNLEAASFDRFVFRSTRSGSGAARLRVTYVLPATPETP